MENGDVRVVPVVDVEKEDTDDDDNGGSVVEVEVIDDNDVVSVTGEDEIVSVVGIVEVISVADKVEVVSETDVVEVVSVVDGVDAVSLSDDDGWEVIGCVVLLAILVDVGSSDVVVTGAGLEDDKVVSLSSI